MWVVLHRLSDDVRHLCITAVVNPPHGVEHTPLHGLHSVNDVRNGPIQDDVRRVVQEPILEHTRQLEFTAVLSKQLVELARSHLYHRLVLCLVLTFFRKLYILDRKVLVLNAHICLQLLIFVTELSKFLLAFPPVRIHLDIEAEEDLLLEEVFHVDTRLGTDLLE